MTREEVTAMVYKYVYRVLPELQDRGLDAGMSYKEMGVDSLALLEVVTGSTKEMKVKIPRNELATINNVNGLVDLLIKAQSQAGA